MPESQTPKETSGWSSYPRAEMMGYRGPSRASMYLTGRDTGSQLKGWANYENIGKANRDLDNTSHETSRYKKNSHRDRNRIFEMEKSDDKFEAQRRLSNSFTHKILRQHAAERRIFSVFFFTKEDDMQFYYESNKAATRGPIVSTLFSICDYFNATMPRLTSTIDNRLPYPDFFHFIDWNLRSIGQVYFCNNPLTGLFMLIGLFIQSTRFAIHGLIGLIFGNTFALNLGFEKGLIASGLFGYNPLLTGLAIALFHNSERHRGYDAVIVLFTIIMAMMTVIIFVSMSKLLVPYKTPPLTLPYNLAVQIFLLAATTMHNVPMSRPGPADFSMAADQDLISADEFFVGTMRGIGQVFMVNSFVGSIFIFLGLGFCSRFLFYAAFFGSLLGNIMAVLFGAPNEMIEQGLFGYASSLTFTAILLFYVPSKGSIFFGTVGIILTVVMQHALIGLFSPYGLPVGTIPFCLITLPLILIQGRTSVIIAFPLAAITIPENHLHRVNMIKDGFHIFLGALKSMKNTRRAKTSMYLRDNQLRKLINKMVSPNRKKYNEDEVLALCVHEGIDVSEKGFITKEEFINHLMAIGIEQEDSLELIGNAFYLMDLSGTGQLKKDEFVSFTNVAKYLHTIRAKISDFLDSIDVYETEEINFDELNAALLYIDHPSLSDEERDLLSQVSGGSTSLNTIDIVKFSVTSSLHEIASLYRESTLAKAKEISKSVSTSSSLEKNLEAAV